MIKKIHVIGSINEEMILSISKEFEKLKKDIEKIEKIYIYIDSDGGSITSTYKLLDILKPYQEKIVTVALKSCKSAATIIFLFGKERYVIKECEFVMHRPAYQLENFAREDERITIPLLKDRIKQLDKDETFLKEFYKNHNVPKDLIRMIFTSTNDIQVSIASLLDTKMATSICQVDYNIIL